MEITPCIHKTDVSIHTLKVYHATTYRVFFNCCPPKVSKFPSTSWDIKIFRGQQLKNTLLYVLEIMDRFHLADCADHACSICIHKIFCNTIILHVLQNAPCCNSLFQVTQRLLLLQYWLKLNHPLMKTSGVSFL